MKKMLFVLLAISLLNACANVQPWERGTLSKPEMAWSPNTLEVALESHVYFSKEGSNGGGKPTGGGCGCN